MAIHGFVDQNGAVQKYDYASLENVPTDIVKDADLDVVIAVQDTEPEEEKTKLWIKETASGGVQVPTYEEFLEVKEDLDEAIEDFAVPTQEAVDNYLNAHPEATTTVQDSSLTEVKFADSLKLKTIKDYVTPEMFGAIGDGLVNDSAAIQAAINSGKTVFMPNTYLAGTTLNVKNDNTVIYVTGEIVFDSDVTIFNIESSYNIIVVNKIAGSYREFEHDTTPNGAFIYYGTAFKLNADGKNVGSNYIFVQSCEFVKNSFLFYANETYGCTYNKIEFGLIRAMYGIKYECGSSGRPWINENTFTGGRLYGNYGIYVRKGENQTDPFNGNKFYNIGFELLYQNAIDCEFFRQNAFENIRTAESLFGDFWINFTPDCQQNTIASLSGVYFKQLNDLNNSEFANIYKFNQIIFPYTWGSTQKTIFFGENQIVKHTKWGWCAESARFRTASLSIVGVSGDQTQYDLPHFGLYGGYDITADTTNGICILNLPAHDGFGYGDMCHKIFIRIVGGSNRFYIRINGTNHAYADNAGYYVLLYLNSADWKLVKISD